MLWHDMVHLLFEENLSRTILKQGRVVLTRLEMSNTRKCIKLVYALYIKAWRYDRERDTPLFPA